MSGLYPSGHGIYNNVLNTAAIHTSLKPGARLFSEVLAEAGYALAYAGKWHVCADEGPEDRGWLPYLVTSVGGQDYHGITWAGWRERARTPEPDFPRGRGEVLRPGWGRLRLYGTAEAAPEAAPYALGDYAIVQAGLRALEELSAREQPWCLYIGPNGPHDPYVIPEHYARMYDPREVELPASWTDDLHDKPRIYARQRRLWDQLTEEEYREAVAHYWGYCTMEDDLLGLVLDALEATGQAEDTLVLFSSDHGDYMAAHGLFAKGVAAFDECYCVPCIVRWPAGIANPGREVQALVTHADMAPTFAELAGTAMPATSGRSLVPFLRNETPGDWPDAVFTQFNGVELYYSQRVVRTHRWRYVYNGFDLDELYDLACDPNCMTNLAPDPAYDSVIREMCSRMWRHAYREDDVACNPYMTVALAPYGPMVGLRDLDD